MKLMIDTAATALYGSAPKGGPVRYLAPILFFIMIILALLPLLNGDPAVVEGSVAAASVIQEGGS